MGTHRLAHQVEVVVHQAAVELGARGIHLFPLFQLRMRQHHGIGALVVEQRIAPAILVGHHLADHDPVVAPVDDLVLLALEAGGGVFQQNGAPDARPVRHARIAVIPGAGKLVGQGDLANRQHVDGEVRGLRKDRVAARTLVDAPEDERRIERHRVEAVGGDPDLPTVGTGRHDRDAGGEVAQRPTEFPGVDHGLCNRGRLAARPRTLRRAGRLSVALAIFLAILRGGNSLCRGVCRHVLLSPEEPWAGTGNPCPAACRRRAATRRGPDGAANRQVCLAPTITRQACKGDGFCQTLSPAVQTVPGNDRARRSVWPTHRLIKSIGNYLPDTRPSVPWGQPAHRPCHVTHPWCKALMGQPHRARHRALPRLPCRGMGDTPLVSPNQDT